MTLPLTDSERRKFIPFDVQRRASCEADHGRRNTQAAQAPSAFNRETWRGWINGNWPLISVGHIPSLTLSECPLWVAHVRVMSATMLQRNLLYTGVTRGKRLVVLVGQKKAIAIAVRNVSGRRRWSKLGEWLRPGGGGGGRGGRGGGGLGLGG
jgi:hypothetical protein